MYGSIGFTRRDKTPDYWRKDFRLTTKAKKAIEEIKVEHDRLFKEFESLPDDISDEDYSKAEKELTINLDALTEKEDTIRKNNYK